MISSKTTEITLLYSDTDVFNVVIKLFPILLKHLAMKVCWGVEVWLHDF
jgi:hypothetical protein